MPRIIFLFFFLSGFSALIYEVAWVRELGLILGNTAQATSTVLAVFLGGLALGSCAGGRLADRWQWSPMKAYGYTEIAVGVTALAVSYALKSSSSLYVWLFHNLSAEIGVITVRLIITIALLLVPTILMGATLPILVRFLGQFRLSSKMFSLLYGINTLGAAFGSLAATFLGFAYIGLQATLLCAAAINVIIGGFCVYLNRQIAPVAEPTDIAEASASAGEESLADTADGAPSKLVAPLVLCLVSFMIGFTALSYEVLWTRLLRFYLSSVTYSFTIMISTFLVGLAIGSFSYEWYYLRKSRLSQRPYLSFGIIQLLAAVACGLSLPVITNCSAIRGPLAQVGLAKNWTLFTEPGYDLLFAFLVVTISILVPAILIGFLFPMIGTLAARQGKNAASSVGLVYGLNTLGCVCGSLLCGLVLMPTIGSFKTFQLTVLISTITGALVISHAEQVPRLQRVSLTAVPVIFAGIFMWSVTFVHVDKGAILLATGEDTNGTVRVLSIPSRDEIRMVLNGSCLATSIPHSRRYMRLMGHLPVLLQSHPANVLVACFGTGTTCASVAMHPEVQHVDLVDISKMVLNAAPLFKSTNFDVLKNPKVEPHVNDVRNYLLITDKKYDVITFEPPPPTEAGIVNLYTEEFYQLVDKRLNENGIMCQWIPMDQDPRQLWKMMIATARTVFPYVSIWLPNNGEAILVASKQPLAIDFENIRQRIEATPLVQSSLSDVGLGSNMALITTFVATGAPLDEYIKDVPSITDDHPRLEFYLPYAGALPSDLEAEAIGLNQLNEMARANKNIKGFDEEEFRKNWQAIHELRLADAATTAGEVEQHMDRAITLEPNNNWFQWARKHINVLDSRSPK